MKAYLIDPFEETVTEVDYDGHLESLYLLLECSIVDAVTCITNDSIFVDDEGLLGVEGQKFFLFPGYPQPLAGKGLFVGPPDEDGNETEPTMPLVEVESLVVYGDPKQLSGFSDFCFRITNMVFDSVRHEAQRGEG